MQTMEMCSKGFASAKTISNSWRRSTSGKLLSRLSRAWSRFMSSRSCIATWRAPTFSCTRTPPPNSVILMFPKSQRKACFTLRQEHHTTRAQRYGKISPMIWNPISGPSAASSTRCAPLCLHSELMTWMVFLSEYSRVSTLQSQVTTRWTCASWLRHCFRFTQQRDLLATRS